mgnify:CR=1 FL=1
MNAIVDHRSLVDALGGNTVVAGIYPCPPVRVGQWKINNRVPPEYWPKLIERAAAMDFSEIDADWLMRTTPPRENATIVSDAIEGPSTGKAEEISGQAVGA